MLIQEISIWDRLTEKSRVSDEKSKATPSGMEALKWQLTSDSPMTSHRRNCTRLQQVELESRRAERQCLVLHFSFV
jgi:hypothetical protein